MKVAVALFGLLCLLGLSYGLPTQEIDETADLAGGPSRLDTELSLNGEEEHGVRFRRVTCDVLSFSTPWGQANHAICAIHCIAMNRGFRGGFCSKGVCNCRR